MIKRCSSKKRGSDGAGAALSDRSSSYDITHGRKWEATVENASSAVSTDLLDK